MKKKLEFLQKLNDRKQGIKIGEDNHLKRLLRDWNLNKLCSVVQCKIAEALKGATRKVLLFENPKTVDLP